MESHQKNAGGNARIAETMFCYFRFPVDFENFVYLSQVQQGLAIKTAITHWRSLKPHCMGALIWQLNDTWPLCSWSSLDHGGGWKLLHHMARAFFQNVPVTAVPVTGGFDLRAVNDTAEAIDLAVEALAVDMAGTTRPLVQKATLIPHEAAVTVRHIAAADIGPDEMLVYVWRDADGTVISGDVFAPKPHKSYDLLPPKLTQIIVRNGADWHIQIDAHALALFVSLEADVPGRFSINAFTVFPGHPATVSFTPTTPGAPPNFTLRDLPSTTYGHA